jgi:hypothetical protein
MRAQLLLLIIGIAELLRLIGLSIGIETVGALRHQRVQWIFFWRY